jgi:hypothetical protein
MTDKHLRRELIKKTTIYTSHLFRVVLIGFDHRSKNIVAPFFAQHMRLPAENRFINFTIRLRFSYFISKCNTGFIFCRPYMLSFFSSAMSNFFILRNTSVTLAIFVSSLSFIISYITAGTICHERPPSPPVSNHLQQRRTM